MDHSGPECDHREMRDPDKICIRFNQISGITKDVCLWERLVRCLVGRLVGKILGRYVGMERR